MPKQQQAAAFQSRSPCSSGIILLLYMTLFLCKQVPDISVIVLCDGCWLSTTVTDACWNCVKIFAAKAKLANVWLSASLARGCTISDDLTAMFTAPKSSSRHGSCQQWGADNISYFIDLCRPSSLRNPLLFFPHSALIILLVKFLSRKSPLLWFLWKSAAA